MAFALNFGQTGRTPIENACQSILCLPFCHFRKSGMFIHFEGKIREMCQKETHTKSTLGKYMANKLQLCVCL